MVQKDQGHISTYFFPYYSVNNKDMFATRRRVAKTEVWQKYRIVVAFDHKCNKDTVGTFL